MNDRTEPGHDRVSSNDSASSAPSRDDDSHRNGRHGSTRDESVTTDRSPSAKPALTDRERRERWPVD